MPIDKRAARKFLRSVRDVLNRDWDPIGGCPEDEYEGYAGRIASMLKSDAPEEDILKYLEWAEVENIGIGPPFDRERAERTISALRALTKP